MVSKRRMQGFTLIEILIVISIIAILSSFAATAVIYVRKQAAVSISITQIDRFKVAVEQFKSDEGYYPGNQIDDPQENAFPALFEALMGEPRPTGKGGRSAPYVEDVRQADIVVLDEDTGAYREATQDERYDPEIHKYILDQWRKPLWYRENKSKERESYMKNPHKFDLWTTGPDTINQILEEIEGKNDDIGNW